MCYNNPWINMLVLIPMFSCKDKLIVHDYAIIRVKHNICQYLLCDTCVKKTSLSSKKLLSFLYDHCSCSMADKYFVNYMKSFHVCYHFCFVWTGWCSSIWPGRLMKLLLLLLCFSKPYWMRLPHTGLCGLGVHFLVFMYQMCWCRGNVPEEQYLPGTLATVKAGQEREWKTNKITMNRILETYVLFSGFVEEVCERRKQFISISYHLDKSSDLPFLQHSCKWVSLQLHCWFHQWTFACLKRNDSTFLSISCTCQYRICISHWGFSQLEER